MNDLPLDEQRSAFERYVVPESRRVPAESLRNTAKVDFKRPHAPLLLIAGGNDHIIPASLNRVNYGKSQIIAVAHRDQRISRPNALYHRAKELGRGRRICGRLVEGRVGAIHVVAGCVGAIHELPLPVRRIM